MELPVIDFIRSTLSEVDTELETRPGSAYYDMFIAPQQLMLQPLINTADQIMVSQSIRQILLQPDPNAYSESDVDDLVANLYVFRYTGTYATTVVRVYYTIPIDKEFPATTAEFTSSNLSFFNSSDISITRSQMALQTDGTLFYVDVPVQAQIQGADYNVDVGSVTGFVNDTDAVRVTNVSAATGGTTRETNIQVLSRASNSIGVRDLETIKGINAILTGNFSFIQGLQPIGFGDPEMQRDIVYNTHVGGKTDVYIKTPSLTEVSQNFTNIDFDYTREIERDLHIEMAVGAGDNVLNPDTGTPNIVVSSVDVREDIVETAAAIQSSVVPASLGIDLTGAEFIKVQIDDLPITLIKVSGAVVNKTQVFEIINSINASVGYDVASKTVGSRVLVTSPTIGTGSQIKFLDPAPHSDASNVLFGIAAFPSIITGVVADRYIETADYILDYPAGLIYQTPYPGSRVWPTILSGQTMISGATDGQITQSGPTFYLNASTSNRFINTAALVKTRVGDMVTITSIGGLTTGTVLGNLPKSFLVYDVVSDTQIELENFTPSGVTLPNTVTYSVKSNQTVIVNYRYSPLSIDIGAHVLLPNGVDRGVRTGRGSYTLNQTPFMRVVSIQQIDPISSEVIGDPLLPPSGFGGGGFGEGGYGVGLGGDYDVRILAPPDRFSVFDAGVILLSPLMQGTSIKVTYETVPELVAVHNFSRNDAERVTGADVLPKNFVPALVDIEIPITRDPTNSSTPSNANLAIMVKDYVNTVMGTTGVKASTIVNLLFDQGVLTIHEPFTMRATVYNTDGTTSIIENQDILAIPDVKLLSQQDNYVTQRIVAFYPNNITVVEV